MQLSGTTQKSFQLTDAGPYSNSEFLREPSNRPTHYLSPYRVTDDGHACFRNVIGCHDSLYETGQDPAHRQSVIGRLEVAVEVVPRLVVVGSIGPIHQYDFRLKFSFSVTCCPPHMMLFGFRSMNFSLHKDSGRAEVEIFNLYFDFTSTTSEVTPSVSSGVRGGKGPTPLPQGSEKYTNVLVPIAGGVLL